MSEVTEDEDRVESLTYSVRVYVDVGMTSREVIRVRVDDESAALVEGDPDALEIADETSWPAWEF